MAERTSGKAKDRDDNKVRFSPEPRSCCESSSRVTGHLLGPLTSYKESVHTSQKRVAKIRWRSTMATSLDL